MEVVWERLSDTKGGNWKHGRLGLRLLRECLARGSLGRVVEAWSNLPLIVGCLSHPKAEVRAEAAKVWDLVRDMPKLRLLRELAVTEAPRWKGERVRWGDFKR